MLAPWKKSCDHFRQHIKKQRHYFANKGPSSQSYGFSSSHVWMWELDHKESWAPKNLCFWTVVLQKALEGPLNCKEIKPVTAKRNQSWIFIGSTDAEAEAPKLSPPDTENWLIGKDPDLGKTEVRAEGDDRWLDGTTDLMDMSLSKLWSWLWTGRPGVLQSWGRKESDTTEWLNRLSDWTDWTMSFINCEIRDLAYQNSSFLIFKGL